MNETTEKRREYGISSKFPHCPPALRDGAARIKASLEEIERIDTRLWRKYADARIRLAATVFSVERRCATVSDCSSAMELVRRGRYEMSVTVKRSKDGTYAVAIDEKLIWRSGTKAEAGAVADFVNYHELQRRNFIRMAAIQGECESKEGDNAL